MSTRTTNYSLVKPELTDAADITQTNGNWDTIDTELNKINSKQDTITGAASTIASSNLSANKALVSNSSGKVEVSTVSSTELGYLSGATGNIQDQLDAMQGSITGAASTIVTNDLTANRAVISNGDGKVAVSSVTSTQLGYLSGATSNIQTQLNGKQDNITYSDTDLTPGTSSLATGTFYAYYE